MIQARQSLDAIRVNSNRDQKQFDTLLPIISHNRKLVHDMACRARAAVADEIVELCNALIRRGNDIVTHIDMLVV